MVVLNKGVVLTELSDVADPFLSLTILACYCTYALYLPMKPVDPSHDVGKYFILFAIFITLLMTTAEASTCYTLGGKPMQIDSPCNPNEAHSICCNDDWLCLGNNACFNPDTNHLARGVSSNLLT